MQFASLGQAQLDLGPAVLEVELQWDDRERLCSGLAQQLVDFVTVCEELASPVGLVAAKAHGVAPRWDVNAKDPQLAVVDSGVPISYLGLALSQRLHFAARKRQAALEGLEYLKIVARSSIGGDDAVLAGGGGTRTFALFKGPLRSRHVPHSTEAPWRTSRLTRVEACWP